MGERGGGGRNKKKGGDKRKCFFRGRGGGIKGERGFFLCLVWEGSGGLYGKFI